MCDYCDCRRIPQIARLGRQHETIQELADKALAARRRGGGQAELEELRQALQPHVREEETGVFALAREAGFAVTNYVDDLEEDHARFAALLDAPRGLDPEALEAFVDELHRHIAVEEYDLFPVAAQLIPEQAWELVATS